MNALAQRLTGLALAPVDAFARELMQPRGLSFDFTEPPGEPALMPADGVNWRIFRNPVSVFVGGVAAVILELAEPRVRTGVWSYTTFRADPLNRLKRTGLAAMATVYGARSKAQALIAGVNRAHARIEGVTPEGEAFRALDVELLDWVQATAMYGFVTAYDRYVHPLSVEEIDAAYREGAPAARLYGAVGAPTSHAEMIRLFDRMGPKLTPSQVLDEFLAIMGAAPVVPAPLRGLQRLLVRAAVDLTPPSLRQRIGLSTSAGLKPGGARLVRGIARLAERMPLASHPANLAAQRLAAQRLAAGGPAS